MAYVKLTTRSEEEMAVEIYFLHRRKATCLKHGQSTDTYRQGKTARTYAVHAWLQLTIALATAIGLRAGEGEGSGLVQETRSQRAIYTACM